jgi:hypothetical protein
MLKVVGCILAAGLLLLGSAAGAQSAITLEPFPSTAWEPKSGVNVTTVHNYYGQCGPAVVQVLGVREQVDYFFTVDAAADVARVVVIAPGGQRSLVLKDVLSDHNGVACVTNGATKYLLLWSNCGGTACGDDFSFTVVDVKQLRVLAGGKTACNEQCAARLTGSKLPQRLNRR